MQGLNAEIKLQQVTTQLTCSDIIFALLSYAVDMTEPIVGQHYSEATALNTDIDKRKSTERMEVLTRAFLAKEMAIELREELKNKLEFFQTLGSEMVREHGKKIALVQKRLEFQIQQIVRAIGIINLALHKFNQHVESQMWNDDKDLNEIMKVFTVLMIICLPQTVTGCLWGMNCTVPWQATEG